MTREPEVSPFPIYFPFLINKTYFLLRLHTLYILCRYGYVFINIPWYTRDHNTEIDILPDPNSDQFWNFENRIIFIKFPEHRHYGKFRKEKLYIFSLKQSLVFALCKFATLCVKSIWREKVQFLSLIRPFSRSLLLYLFS